MDKITNRKNLQILLASFSIRLTWTKLTKHIIRKSQYFFKKLRPF